MDKVVKRIWSEVDMQHSDNHLELTFEMVRCEDGVEKFEGVLHF